VFVEPLTTATLLGTLPAAGLLAVAVGPGWFVPASLCALWLAGLWLVLVQLRGGAGLFTAFQAALTVAVGLAVTAWLEHQPWLAGGMIGLLDPRSLNAYGIALAALSLAGPSCACCVAGGSISHRCRSGGKPPRSMAS
jgi:hypothetical protein